MSAVENTNTLAHAQFSKPVKLLIVTGHSNSDITQEMLAGAKAALKAAGVGYEMIDVPGVMEIASAIAIAERTSNFDGYVALGCVLRGQGRGQGAKAIKNTCHSALGQLGLGGICVGNGVLCAKMRKRAKPGAATLYQDNGTAAANAALHLVALSRKWGQETKGIGFKPASSEFLMADNPADNAKDGPKTA